MIIKKVINNELYVWMNGSLLYKRWINQNYGMVFCNKWGNRNFTAKDVEGFKLILTDK